MAIRDDGFISAPFLPVGRDFNDPAVKRELNSFYKKLASRMTKINFLPPEVTITTGAKPMNLDASWLVYVSNVVADTEDTVNHFLGRVPNFVLLGTPDKDAAVYRTATDPTTTQIFLAASAVTVTINILLF